MSRIGELIAAAVLGGLTVAAVAFGVSRVSAQESAAAQPQQPIVAQQAAAQPAAVQFAEIEAVAFADDANLVAAPAAVTSLDEMAAGGGCGIDLDPEFATALREASQAAVAQALGMTVDELEAAREAGQDVRQIAEAKGIDLETVQAAVDAARQQVIQQGVADGTITQEQADWLLEHPRHGRGGHGGGGPQVQVDPEVRERIRTAVQAAVANTLGMTVEELEAAHEAGTDLRELAEAASVEPEAIRTAAQNARNTAIDQAVADGLLTAEEAETLKNAPQRPGGHHGGQGGPHGGPQGGPQGNPNP